VCGADVRLVAPQADPYAGATLVGKYRLVELIGSGAMGRVYRAEHLALETLVAVKLLNQDLAADSQIAKRFHHEARLASRLRHPNAITTLDFGRSESGDLFIVMELLRGRSLGRIIQTEAPLAPTRIVSLLGQALTALDEAHAAGLIHRDFKPENIFVETLRGGGEHVKVLDFGIAKLRGDVEGGLTSTGAVCGTPEYMSPEQIRGEELDGRSDVYAAGVILYEMLVGRLPFPNGGPTIEVLMAHLKSDVEPPSRRRPGVSPQLEAVCLRALAKSRDARFASAGELKEALFAALDAGSGAHCQSCGARLSETARFCPQCGATLRAPSTSAPSAPPAPREVDARAPAATLDERAPAPPRSSQSLPLVGREELLGRLQAAAGRPVLLVGKAGMGKTRLVEEWREHESARGRRAIVSGPDPSGAARPWWPVRRALGQLLGLDESPTMQALEEATRQQLDDRVGLATLFGLTGAGAALPLDVRRRECTAATLGTLRRAPLTVIFEDVDQYDEPSRRILAELMTQPGPVSVVATARRADVQLPATVLRVDPLDPVALAALDVGDAAGMAGGVPFALDQLLRARAEQAPGSTAEARIAALSPAARALVEALAVAGSGVPLGLFGQLCGVENPSGAVGELAERGWLRDGEAPELASPTLRDLVLEGLSSSRQRTLHDQMAHLLAGQGGDPTVVAHHACLAGDGSLWATIERAGDAAREGFDDERARRWYQAALEFLERASEAGNDARQGRIRVALKLALVLRYRGELHPSQQVLTQTLELARARGSYVAEVEAHKGLAYLNSAWKNLEAARDHLVGGIQAALRAGDRELLASLYLDLADVLGRLGDTDGAERELWEGVLLCTGGDGAEASSGPDVLWRMLLRLGQLAHGAGRLEEARTLGRQALRHAGKKPGVLSTAHVHAFLGDVLEAMGRFGDAAVERRTASEQLRRAGDRRKTAETLLLLARLQGVDAAEARAWLKEADALSAQIGWQEGVTRSRVELERLRA
jgi:serine/threonine-protein kinase